MLRERGIEVEGEAPLSVVDQPFALNQAASFVSPMPLADAAGITTQATSVGAAPQADQTTTGWTFCLPIACFSGPGGGAGGLDPTMVDGWSVCVSTPVMLGLCFSSGAGGGGGTAQSTSGPTRLSTSAAPAGAAAGERARDGLPSSPRTPAGVGAAPGQRLRSPRAAADRPAQPGHHHHASRSSDWGER